MPNAMIRRIREGGASKKKNILAFILALMLVFAAGCASDSEGAESDDAEAASAQTSAEASGDEASDDAERAAEEAGDPEKTDDSQAADDSEEDVVTRFVDYTDMKALKMVEANRAMNWLISNEPVTLRVMINNTQDHPEDMNLQALYQVMEKRTNVHVDWVMPGSSSFREQVALALAGGDMPDVILNGLTDSDLRKYGANGTLAAFDRLMEEFPDAAPNIARMFEQYPDTKVYVTAPNRHIYSMPRINEESWRKQDGNLIINQVWLDNLGLSMPTTIEEFKDVLLAFKNGDPNGNEEADEIPYLINLNSDFQSWSGLSYLMGSFHAMPANDYRMMQNDRLVNVATTDGWRQGIIYLNDLYANGLIDLESFTIDDGLYIEKLMADPPVVGAAQIRDIDEQISIEGGNEVYSYVPPLKGPDGQEPWVYKSYKAGWERGGCVIWNDTPIPEIALMWVDYCYDPINSIEMAEGLFDVLIDMGKGESDEHTEESEGEPDEHTEMSEGGFSARLEYLEEDGIFIIGEPPAGITQQQYRHANSPGDSGAWAIFESEYLNVLRPAFSARGDFNATHCAPYYVEPFPPVFFTEEQSETAAILNADIFNEIIRRSCEWIVNGGVEDDWDAYLDRLDAMGLQEWLKINNDASFRFR